MEQLEFKVESKCDKCDEFKPRAFSYFTDRMWYCDECKVEIAKSILKPDREPCQLNDDAPFKPCPTISFFKREYNGRGKKRLD